MTTQESERLWWHVVFDCDETDNACLSQWKTVHIAAIIPGSLSILSCIFIIVSAIKYRKILSKISFAAQIPIYIGICDLGYEIFHTGDHWHSLTNLYVMEGVPCKCFGSMKPFWINTQTAWALGCAVYLYRSILSFKASEPTFGKNNIYLHVCCWGIPITILIFGFIFNVYGPEGPWCGIPEPIIDFLIVDLWILVALVVLIVVYSAIIYKIYVVVKQSESHNTDQDEGICATNDKMKKVIRTIGIYPIAYFIQWFAYAFYKLHIAPRGWGWILFLVILSNSGGCMNLFLYGPLLFNQIKRVREKQRNHVVENDINQNKTHAVVPSGLTITTTANQMSRVTSTSANTSAVSSDSSI